MTPLSIAFLLICVHDSQLPCRCMLHNAAGWARCRSLEEHVHAAAGLLGLRGAGPVPPAVTPQVTAPPLNAA